MTRGQIIILILMSVMVVMLFAAIGIVGFSLINADAPNLDDGAELAEVISPTPTETATITPTSTSAFTPTPTETLVPTSTATRVVLDTATPTITPTPAATDTPEATPTSTTVVVGGGGVSSGRPASSISNPVIRPTSQYPFNLAAEPVAYETDNHFFVILTRVTINGVPAAGYRLAAQHWPTGYYAESDVSCDELCRASGPGEIENEDGEVIATFSIQEGNINFEYPAHLTGYWSIWLIDEDGRRVSEALQLPVSEEEDEWQWFYVHLNK